MHLKRNNIQKFFSIPRKGTKYVALSDHNQRQSIPLIVVARDMLKIVSNKKELKKLLNEKQIKINGREIRETNYPLSLFDILSLANAKKNYRASLSDSKKMILEEISEKESKTKIFKVMNKKILSGKEVQLNLSQGRNLLSKEKVKIGDSVVLDIEENKIIKIIPLEKGMHAFVIEGKHMGQQGRIEELLERGGKTIAKISVEDGRINVWVKNLIVMEK
jgi:small subunit ribosomal protein S4e